MTVEASFGPGKYFFGDPCYALNDETYDKEWGEKHNYEDGDYAPIFAVGRTKYGDGSYYDEYGHEFSVDSGSLALTCLEDGSVLRSQAWPVDRGEERRQFHRRGREIYGFH